MFDKYMICDEYFKPSTGNEKIGFQIGVRITYYRGVALSLIDGFSVKVDGTEYNNDQLAFTVKGKTYTFAEMRKTTEVRWDFGEVAVLTVYLPKPLKAGPHEIEITERVIQDYGTMPMWLNATTWKKTVQVA